MKQKVYLPLFDGKKLYVELYCSGKKDTILLIHGGPGESCITFSYFATLLSNYVNVVSLDQRGVMRSEAETTPSLVTINQLIADFEYIREQLGIAKWYLLGHSFGGYLAMRYALAAQKGLCGIIYENPCFDIGSAVHQILERYAALYSAEGETEKLRQVQQLCQLEDSISQFDGIMTFPDVDRKHIFGSEAISQECRNYFDSCDITEAAIERCMHHYQLIRQDVTLKNNYLSELNTIIVPSVLIQSAHDPMLSEQEKCKWLENPNCSAVRVECAGHYIHSDQPLKMLEMTMKFIRSHFANQNTRK